MLDLYGSPDSEFLLIAAERTASVDTDLGVLRLDPKTVVLCTTGRLGPGGRAARAFATPPEFQGRTLYWQAVVGMPARLTNLEPTAFLQP